MSLISKMFGKAEKEPVNPKLTETAAALAESTAEHMATSTPKRMKRLSTKPKTRPRTPARIKRKRLRQMAKKARVMRRSRA